MAMLTADLGDLIRERRGEFLVHGRVYTDPEVFELELEKIFYRTWVYVGHESEIAQGGDYKTTCIGRQPVIVTRDPDDGQVYVLYNRCRHRGATVCQYEYGTSTYFRCAYHSWTYNNRGELVGVPFPKGYGETFDLREFGLVQVPRAASYRGFIFASLSPEGPNLEEHLGNARFYFDLLARRTSLDVRCGVDKVGYNGNWKYQLENTFDVYHVPHVHQTVFEIQARRRGMQRTPGRGERQRDLGNGHGTAEMSDLDPLEPGYDPQREPWRPWEITVFPNLAVLAIYPQPTPPPLIRVIRPVTVDRTEVFQHPLLFGTAQQRANQLWDYIEFFGAAGFGSPDDKEIFERLNRGLKAEGNEWVILSRGLAVEEIDERGIRTVRNMASEVQLRALWRQWRRLMAA